MESHAGRHLTETSEGHGQAEVSPDRIYQSVIDQVIDQWQDHLYALKCSCVRQLYLNVLSAIQV